MRVVASTGIDVMLALIIGVIAAAGLAAVRGGQFSQEFTNSLWIVGCLVLLMTLVSLSPSTRHGPGEVSNVLIGRRFRGTDERGGAGLTVTLALSAFGMFGIALLVN